MANRKWITEDFYWKIFSVALAVIVWLIVNKIRSGTVATGLLSVSNTFTNVPVIAVAANANVQNARVVPGAVSVTVSGAPSIVATLETNQLHATVDLTGIEVAHNLIRNVDVALPPRVTIIEVDPSVVAVTISTNQ
ncbi:MAG TPA: CdaR family protein [Verrucomicrobiae bacterium]|nr:CdaR family protein [Verrucomicrobiae bacterium]